MIKKANYKENLIRLKKSQVTIFIIFGLIFIVIFVLIYFFINGNKPVVESWDDKSKPAAYIELCTREAVEEAIGILSTNGGDINPKGSLDYDGEKITYLCFNDNYYQTCVNQRPLLIEHLENEITNYIRPKVEDCFSKLYYGLKQNSKPELSSDMKITTNLYPEQILVTIDRDLKISNGKDNTEIKRFKMNKPHPLYNLAKLSMEIVNQEAKYCNFDVLGYMIAYPRYDIKSIITGTSDTIYTVTDLPTNEKFRFAIKTCVLPAGF